MFSPKRSCSCFYFYCCCYWYCCHFHRYTYFDIQHWLVSLMLQSSTLYYVALHGTVAAAVVATICVSAVYASGYDVHPCKY